MQQKQSKAPAGLTATELRIDADYFAYKACSSNEEELDWGLSLTTIYSDAQQVRKSFLWSIDQLQQRFDTNTLTLYFTDHHNFRKDIDPEYKGNRIRRKPCGYKRLMDWCWETFRCKALPGLEADDVLGLDCHLQEGDFILISPDKDLKQISCRQFDGENERDVSPEEADRFFLTQVITGDQVDGYKGIPGMGAVKAAKLLDSTTEPWQAIVQAYEKAGLTLDDAIRNARLARILRPGEYNFDTHTVNLWTPQLP